MFKSDFGTEGFILNGALTQESVQKARFAKVS